MPKLFNSATNKRGLIVFGGEASADYGIVVSEAPTFERPTRQQTVYNVPGRSGSVVIQRDAWNDVVRKYKVWLSVLPNADLVQNVDAFAAWLNSQTGYVRLEDSFEPEVFRLAYYSGGNDISNEMMQFGECSLAFTCKAQRFYKSGETVQTVNTGNTIGNPTRFASKPLIHVEAVNKQVTIVIGTQTFQVGVEDYVDIDCDTMQCYRGTTNKNSSFSGSFPVLKPGNNTFTITNADLVTVKPRFFTI